MAKIFESPDGGKTVYEREAGASPETRQKVESEFETCVICGKETNVPVKQHVDFRDFYIEGAGQLCKSCYLNEGRQLIAIPERLILENPNDADLGWAIRKFYWDSKQIA